MSWPDIKPNQLVPSTHMKLKISTAPTAVVRVGATPTSHLTILGGQVIVKLPAPPCSRTNVKDWPATAVGKVRVQPAVRVIYEIPAVVGAGIVWAAPEVATVFITSVTKPEVNP